MSMLSVPVKDLNEKKTIDNDTYVVCGNTEANKISYENLVKPLRDELNSTMNRKSKSVSVRTDASIPYYANEFICVNRTNADVTTPNVGTFSTSGLFTFAEDMTALFVASISGRPDSTGRIWLNLVRYSDNYKYDSNIIYGGYATCTFNTVIKAKKGEQIALGTVEKFQMNSGGFASNMAVIRLD